MRTLTSTSQAYRVLQWNCMEPVRKSRTTRIDTLFNEIYNKVNHSIPSAKNQSKIHEVGNVELCELLDMESKTQCKVCSSYGDIGIVYCTCGRRTRNLSRKGDTTGTIMGRNQGITSASQWTCSRRNARREISWASTTSSSATKSSAKNMFDIGHSEELCREMDKLANEDQTHHATAEEICVYRNNWWLRSNTVRSDTVPSQAELTSSKHCQPCDRSNTKKIQLISKDGKVILHLGGNWQESWWHFSCEHHHEDGPSTAWSGKPVEKWLGYFSREFTWCIVTNQNSVTANSSLLSPTESVKNIPPNTENSMQYGHDENNGHCESHENKCATNYSIITNNNRNDTHNKHLTMHNKCTNDDVDFDDCVVHIMHWVCT